MQAIKLPQNINTSGWEPSASFSSDEKMLFFTSDREGGKGGTDIYSIKKLPNGEWALPQNLGEAINTPYDEDSPYLHPDGKTLYFSSNGHNTMGGFDIFTSKWDEETQKWSVPENVGYPINTPHDDLHFSWSADGRRVYFSSIRPDCYDCCGYAQD
jgi:Tol biopolymer transport system component